MLWERERCRRGTSISSISCQSERAAVVARAFTAGMVWSVELGG